VPSTRAHIAIRVPDVELVLSRLRAAGLARQLNRSTAVAGVKVCDPCGNLVELLPHKYT
jgi:hypothetical protein